LNNSKNGQNNGPIIFQSNKLTICYQFHENTSIFLNPIIFDSFLQNSQALLFATKIQIQKYC